MDWKIISRIIFGVIIVAIMFLGREAVTNFKAGNVNDGLAALACVVSCYVNIKLIEIFFYREPK